MSANTQDGNSNDTSSGNPTGNKTADDVRQAFSELPFEQKFTTLIRIELDMLGDAVETVVTAASQAIDDIATACSDSAGAKTPRPDGQASTT